MRKLVLFVLLFCLGFCACGSGASDAGALTEAPKLPVLKPETPDPIPGLPWEAEELPVLSSPEGETPTVSGPAGTVEALTFLGAWCTDPVYGDVDGDGMPELLYLCSGPTSGLYTEAVCVYGLELGWPVLKGCTIFNLSWGEPHLEQDEDAVMFCLKPVSWHPGGTQEREALWLPVTLSEGRVLLNGGAIPEDMAIWGGANWNYYGMSFAELSRQLTEQTAWKHWSCMIWQERSLLVMDSDPAGKTLTDTYAALTDNGVTVTGLFRWEALADGESRCMRNGVEPIPPVEDPQSLTGLTEAELEARLGPCHFDLGSGLRIPAWFTEDGKLLIVHPLSGASLTDLLAGELPFTETPDPDTVTVDGRSIPTLVQNMERWEAFLETTARGETDAVTLRQIYDDGSFLLSLSYDGGVYTLTDEGKRSSYRYLIVSEDDDPPAQARFRRAVHYLLSDDLAMSSQRYFAHIVSSVYDPSFPNTRSVFTVYDP